MFRKKVDKLHTYNAPELIQMTETFGRMGLTIMISSLYSPHSKGLAGRMNRVLVENGRKMIDRSDLKWNYWCGWSDTQATCIIAR